MPTDTAATCPCRGLCAIRRRRTSCSQASASATKPPVIAAVRVPPSAWSTSQSSVMVRSPRAFRSATARSERPMRRWISCVRPLCRPRAASRAVRVCVARGSMPYSAVIHPWPLPRRKAGTVSSTLAVHSTWVSPYSTSTEPSACLVWRRAKRTGRNSSGARPEGLLMAALIAQPAQRRRGGVIAAVAGALDRALPELQELRAQRAGGAHLGDDLLILEGTPEAIRAHEQHVVRLNRPPPRQGHLRQDRVPAEAALDEVAHGVLVRLLGVDEALAQQQLDVTVVAAARHQRRTAQVIEATVADVRPPARVLLHQTHRTGRPRALLERQLHAELDHFLV